MPATATTRRRKLGAFVVFLGALMLAFAAYISPVSADDVTGTGPDGFNGVVTTPNPKVCESGLKIDDIPDEELIPVGDYSIPINDEDPPDLLTITILTSTGTQGSLSFTWESNLAITGVNVKGGTTTSTFPGGTSGSVSFTVNHWYSHIDFCIGEIQVPDTGDLYLDKTATGDVPAGGYDFTVACVDDEQDAIDLNGTADGTTRVLSDVLASADPVLVAEDLPIGAVCTLTETDDNGADTTSFDVSDSDWGADGTGFVATATVPEEGGSATVTFTNDFDGGGSSDDDDDGGGGGRRSTVTDVCDNITGVQDRLPDGMVFDGRDCVPEPDVCQNIDGTQAEVPEGLELDSDGNCVEPVVDVCPNVDGVQTEVPEGLTLDEAGACVEGEVLGVVISAPATAEAAPAELPRTGATSTTLALAGGALVLLGVVMSLASRRAIVT